MRKTIPALAVLAALAAGGTAAAAVLPEVPVLTSKRSEFVPAAGFHASGDELLAFSRTRAGKPRVFDAYLRRTTPAGAQTVKLNTRGRGFSGGIDSPRVVYQQVVRGNSNLKLYDVDTRARSNPPAGVNTRHWEWGPTVSGDWLLFGRDGPGYEQRIILFNLVTRQQRVLSKTARRDLWTYAGQVNGNWAVYFRCTREACNVFRYDIAARAQTRLPKPTGRLNRAQYGSSVTPAGVVYAGRSGAACGSSARIVRFFGPTDPAQGTVVARIARERDLFNSFARVNPDGSTDVFYDRIRCGRTNWNVYRVRDPAP